MAALRPLVPALKAERAAGRLHVGLLVELEADDGIYQCEEQGRGASREDTSRRRMWVDGGLKGAEEFVVSLVLGKHWV